MLAGEARPGHRRAVVMTAYGRKADEHSNDQAAALGQVKSNHCGVLNVRFLRS